MKRIIFLVGPTAVGKTRVSLHLAKLIDAEIISCDSMQVYRGMDIGTQKPTPAQRKMVRHHMVDIIGPGCKFDAAEFRKRSLRLIKDMHKRGKMPLFVGGTALYMKALVDGLFPGPSADSALRKTLMRQEEVKGKGSLYRRLLELDPETAGMLHPNDIRRIVRALEVYIKTDKPISELKKKANGLGPGYDLKLFCLNRNRHDLYSRIEARVDKMFKQGFVRECRRLKANRFSLTASQALGYKEVFACLDGEVSSKEARELIKRNTRRFAKRQLSWFRGDKRIVWVDIDKKKPKEAAEAVYALCMK